MVGFLLFKKIKLFLIEFQSHYIEIPLSLFALQPKDNTGIICLNNI
jgi:hypothetical protein